MNQLSLTEKIGPNYVLFELVGDVNSYTISELQEKMDMSTVSSMDSSGLGIILAGINDGEKFGTKLFIMNPSDAAHYSLTRTGFWNTFYIIHSVTEVSDAM